MKDLVPWQDFGVTIRIGETHYLLKPLYNGKVWHGWRLTKADGSRYSILRHDAPLGVPPRSWWECECADFVMRHDHNDTPGCKHILTLRCIGLI